MKFFEFRFRQADFYTLPVARRVYAVRLAQLHNDLRYIRQLVKVANNGVQKLRGVDQQVSLHQLLFAVRLWYGALHEGWRVVTDDWKTSGFARDFRNDLTASAQSAHRQLSSYFQDSNNLVHTMRTKFGHHYDREHILRNMRALKSDKYQSFVSTQHSANLFYTFAEQVRSFAIADATGYPEPAAATKRLYDELLRVHDNLDALVREIVPLVLRECYVKRRQFKSGNVTDSTNTQPIIFEDEDVMMQYVARKKRPQKRARPLD